VSGDSPPAAGEQPATRHLAGLDGIRALAVLGIVAFHTGLSSIPGGFYGVDAFFVLSGYLITSLLLTEWAATGGVRLGRFWARRARRLLPALLVLVAVLAVVMSLAPRLLATPDMLGDALATLFYASNWFSIHAGASYFAATAQPSPLLHTWSLAIEEQFYLVWPLIVLAVLTVGMRRRRASGGDGGGVGRRWGGVGRRWGGGVTHVRTVRMPGGGHLTVAPSAPEAARDLSWIRRRRLLLLFGLASVGALASAAWMAHLAPDGYTTRAYYGTDTRAQALLIGSALAVGLVLWKERAEVLWFRRLAAALGLVGLVGTGVLWSTTSEWSRFAFCGGFLVAGLCAGMVVLGAVVAPRGPAVRLLELPPLPALGRISYGVYLWYWPVLLVMSGSRLHWGVYPLFLARMGVTVVIASLSAEYIEGPIRRGALPSWRALVAVPAAFAATIALVFASTLVPVSASSLPGSSVVRPPAPVAGSLTDVAAPAPTGPPTKVLLVGDSVAGTLGVGLSRYEANDNVQIVNEGIPGCSLAMTGSEIKVLFYTVAPTAPCGPGDPGPLLSQWQKWVDAYNPDVVVYVARGETFDQELGSQWEQLGQPGFDSYVESRYRQAIQVLGSKGATVVLMTTPYYDSGTQPSGSIWPEDTPSRVTIDNQLIRQAAGVPAGSGAPGASNLVQGSNADVFNLGGLVSPDNQFASAVDGVSVRCGDGVHFTPSGGEFIGLQLLPILSQLGKAHHAASPGGAWVGDLPPSTPSWYSKLPC
jgi:peptidoglycan/LPS O-acetylase OafA/YrhL